MERMIGVAWRARGYTASEVEHRTIILDYEIRFLSSLYYKKKERLTQQ